MSLSIRNQLAGTVTAVTPGEVMATVKVRLTGGQEITAAVTLEAVEELGLAEGSAVEALVKSTEVSLATGPVEGLSIRNQIPRHRRRRHHRRRHGLREGLRRWRRTDRRHHQGGVADLKLTPGSSAVALIKSTEISLTTA